jgi:hypothetical protein
MAGDEGTLCRPRSTETWVAECDDGGSIIGRPRARAVLNGAETGDSFTPREFGSGIDALRADSAVVHSGGMRLAIRC